MAAPTSPVVHCLPNELLDNAFAYLDLKDWISLRKAHRYFHRSAQRLALRNVRLPISPHPRDAGVLGDFFDVIQSDGVIVGLIHNLELTYDRGVLKPTYPSPQTAKECEKVPKSSSIIKKGLLQQTLGRLSYLQKVTIDIAGEGPPSPLDKVYLPMLHDM